jgi:hypothetical protein
VSYSCSNGCTYNIAPISGCTAPLTTVWGPIQTGPEAGLYAQIIPVTMNVAAQRANGQETVSMSRTAEVALIPVFQFGVFCDGDCAFGRTPNLSFAGRLHTNGDLYLGVADPYHLVFGDKISVFGNIIREQMDNAVPTVGNYNSGMVLIPTASGGCNAQLTNVANATPSSTCVDISTTALGATNGSIVGGHGSAQFTGWQNVSLGNYNSYIIDGNGTPPNTTAGPNSTGATLLNLPFVQGTTSAVQIIRRPPPLESTSSLLGGSRLANQAQIRVLLSDTEDGLHLSDWNGNAAQDYQLVSGMPTPVKNLLQAASASPGTQAGALMVGPTTPPTTNRYYSFGESYCTGNTFSAVTTVGTNYAVNYAPAAAIAGSGANQVFTAYNGLTTRACPTLTGTGTYNGALSTITDTNFIIPPYYGSPSQTFPPTSYPQWPPQTFPAPTSAANFNLANGTSNGLEWPLVGGWLLVEVKWASDGRWHGVTQEWLQLGFARGLNVPTQPGTTCATPSATFGVNSLTTPSGCNYLADHRNAILYFEETKDSKLAGAPGGAGTADAPLTANYYDSSAINTKSQYNFCPINLYDAREGENYDSQVFPAGTGTPNGIMNVVELDVGNLRNWLLGNIGSSGTSVDYVTQNGYVLYFSDRRGMQFAQPTGGTNPYNQWGEYGYEDVVNYVNSANAFKPDGALEPPNYNGVSPEDVNANGVLDVYGVVGVGDAFGPSNTRDTDVTVPHTPFSQNGGTAERILLRTFGLANRVTGARHGLKLVDGSIGNLPTMPPASGCSYTNANGAPNPTGCGGFTVAAENPVYVQGNYNSNCPSAASLGCTTNNGTYDATWTNTAAAEPNHAAASVIADSVYVLSNNWKDAGCVTISANCTTTINQTTGSLVNPTNPGGQTYPATQPNRIAIDSYYRMAVASGKPLAFSNVAQIPEFAFGMDGGIHNFLKLNEDWGGIAAQANLWYKGSMVQLYYAQYNTGTFKCCNLTQNPPVRQFSFDSLFSLPQNLPPGTPMFRNVDNLSYRQNQIARTN